MFYYYTLLIVIILFPSSVYGISLFNDSSSLSFVFTCPNTNTQTLAPHGVLENLSLPTSCNFYFSPKKGFMGCTSGVPCPIQPGLTQNAAYTTTLIGYGPGPNQGPYEVLYYYGGLNITNKTSWVVHVQIYNGTNELQSKYLDATANVIQYTAADLKNLSTVTVVTHAEAVGASTYTLNCTTYPSEYDSSYAPITITSHDNPPTAPNCTLVSSSADAEEVPPQNNTEKKEIHK